MAAAPKTLDLFPQQDQDLLFFEKRASRAGFHSVAGVDEVGRGPLAGPVVAAAVILPPGLDLPGLTDSKKLSAAKRERFFPIIRQQACAIGLGMVQAEEIDVINILEATLKAMNLAVTRLCRPADFLLVDGIFKVPCPLEQQTIKKGDSLSLSIAAASVVAKVVRDRIMTAQDRRYPGYDFASNKGYGSARHLQAVATQGPCPIHRLTFKGVREHAGS